MKRVLFVLTLLCALVVSGLSPERSQAQQPPSTALVRVFIDLPSRPGLTDRALVNTVGGNVRWEFATSNTISVEVPQAALPYLMQLNGRFFNIRVEPTVTALETIDWGVDQINAEQVWGGAENAVAVTGNGGSGATVAVIDTGIASHPDLTVAGGYNFAANPDNTNYADDNGHGTHVAGTIAARDNGGTTSCTSPSSKCLVGVAPQATLYALKALGANGSGSLGDVVKAIEWATGINGGTKVDIISMSLGCYCNDTAMRNAVDAAYAAGVLVVAAAGNCGTGGGEGCPAAGSSDTVIYPGKYDSVIAVASTTSSNAWSSFSSVGPAVELAAPGSSIKSTVPSSCGTTICNSSGYNTISGTSMATPHVSGLAALIKAANPSMTASQIRTRMQETATNLGAAGWDSSFGYGLINAVAAVGAGSPPPPPAGAFVACTAQAAVTSSSGDNNGYQTTPENACADGGGFAVDTNSGSSTSTSCTATQKDKHLFSNFNAGVASGASINGIEVRLDARADSTSGSPRLCVQLSWNGGTSWTTAKQTANITTSEQSYILGSASDNWGRTWTSSELSNANFRVRVINVASSTSRDFSLDWVALRVTSTGGTPIVADTTPPSVDSTSPVASATGVAVNANVTATFNEAMNSGSITNSSFTLAPTSGGGNLSAGVTYSGNTATLNPASDLAMNTSYTATLSTSITDAAGNPLAAVYSWSFMTFADTVAPTVQSTSPVNDATGVAVNANVTATFSEAMNPGSITSSFTLAPTSGGGNLSASVTYAGTTATLNPVSDLAIGTNYTASLSTSITDAAGNPLATVYTWSFTTFADTGAPTVQSTSPAGNATGVAIGANVTATFSEAMNSGSITSSTFTLAPTSGGGNIGAVVTYSGNTATLNPSANLENNTSYTATIASTVSDSAGNPLAGAYTWSFTTVAAAPADTTNPTVTARTPNPGATGIATNATVQATFSEAMNEVSVETAGRFTVRTTSGSVNVPGTVVYTGNVATFTPSSALDNSTSYTVTLSTSMTDLAGNPLTLPSAWTFTTAAAASTACVAPTIVSSSDSSASGAGSVSFSWNPVAGATQYTIQRNFLAWSTVTTTSATSFSGSDSWWDNSWRVYVSAGTCTGVPGPMTTFNP